MNATEVDAELLVDEDPEIVVAREGEHLAAEIDELGVQLEREMEVVVSTLVPQ